MLYLFDIDGTLLSGDGAGRRAFERACREVLGLERALEGLALDGMTDPLILDHAFGRLGRAPRGNEEAAVERAYVGHLGPELALARFRVLEGVFEALAHLEARRAVVGLATGNWEEGARLKLARGGLAERFPFGGFGSDARDRADLVRVAVARGRARAPRALSRDEIWVIGDTPRDVAAAHAAGVRALGVATGRYTPEALHQAGADQVHASLTAWLATLS